MKKIEVWLNETSEGIAHEAIATYTKGPLYCVQCTNGIVYKYPIVNIFRIIEEYGMHSGEKINQDE